MWLLTAGSGPDVHAPACPQPNERNVFMTEDLVAAAIKAAGDLTELMQMSWRDSLQHARMPEAANQ
jgi:hypothetical protein